jgi:hypothetical protein
MLRITILAAALAASLATAGAASAQAFLGAWTATAKAPGGDTTEVIKVTKTADGYALTGQAPVDTISAGKDVALDGNNFSFKRTLTAGGNTLEIDYKGVVTGDSFTGTASVAGMDIPYTGVRAPAGQ